MPYVTSIERLGREEGRSEGRGARVSVMVGLRGSRWPCG